MGIKVFWSFFFLIGVQSALEASVFVKQYRRGQEIRVISIESSERTVHKPYVILRSIPYLMDEGPKSSNFLYEEIQFQNRENLPEIYQNFLANQPRQFLQGQPAGAETRIIVNQGPPKNRINLTIVGDGYTLDEKQKFFEDATRISKDLFEAKAFATYLPLFNIYAVYVPSNESGISDITKKDTALGLYRSPPGSKRGIGPGNPSAIDAALKLAPATDFPILIANDDYYGGLGGRYAISTRSVLSGSLVLRHELGHNFGDVGEEYDGGGFYGGANFHPRKNNFPWARWVDGDVPIYDSKFLAGNYVWKNLRAGSFISNFTVPSASEAGPYHTFIRLSSVGWTTPEDVSAIIDGHPISFSGIFTPDRSFFDVKPFLQLAPGPHRLEITENIHDEDNVLAYAQIAAHRPDYDYTSNKIGAFATFNDSGTMVGYRPTDDSCLMRNMRSAFFCSVDKENMWIRFLNRIDLIDSVKTSSDRKVILAAAALKGLSIRWYKLNGSAESEIQEARDQREWTASQPGSYRVRVSFRTPEVRAYTTRFQSLKDFQI